MTASTDVSVKSIQDPEIALLQEVFAKIPSAIVVIDDHGLIKKANEAALQLLGQSTLEGRRWVEVITLVFRPRDDDGHEISTRDGRRLQVATLPLSHGQLVQMTDLTETRLLQDKLSHMERLSSLGRMAASLAHQIRTPLSAAMLYASNLGNARLSPEAHQRFQEKLVNRLQALEAQVSDILMFARSNEQTVSEMDASELLVQTANNVTAILTRANAHLLTVVEPNVHYPILGNATALNGALSNLIANAVEAGAKKIVLKLEQVAERIVFSVANDGPPIPEELRSKIFEPFFTSKSSGTGLGLAVVTAVTKVHQGIVSLGSWPGPFATVFTISLPRYEAKEQEPSEEVTQAINAVVEAKDSQLLSTAAATLAPPVAPEVTASLSHSAAPLPASAVSASASEPTSVEKSSPATAAPAAPAAPAPAPRTLEGKGQQKEVQEESSATPEYSETAALEKQEPSNSASYTAAPASAPATTTSSAPEPETSKAAAKDSEPETHTSTPQKAKDTAVAAAPGQGSKQGTLSPKKASPTPAPAPAPSSATTTTNKSASLERDAQTPEPKLESVPATTASAAPSVQSREDKAPETVPAAAAPAPATTTTTTITTTTAAATTTSSSSAASTKGESTAPAAAPAPAPAPASATTPAPDAAAKAQRKPAELEVNEVSDAAADLVKAMRAMQQGKDSSKGNKAPKTASTADADSGIAKAPASDTTATRRASRAAVSNQESATAATDEGVTATDEGATTTSTEHGSLSLEELLSKDLDLDEALTISQLMQDQAPESEQMAARRTRILALQQKLSASVEALSQVEKRLHESSLPSSADEISPQEAIVANDATSMAFAVYAQRFQQAQQAAAIEAVADLLSDPADEQGAPEAKEGAAQDLSAAEHRSAPLSRSKDAPEIAVPKAQAVPAPSATPVPPDASAATAAASSTTNKAATKSSSARSKVKIRPSATAMAARVGDNSAILGKSKLQSGSGIVETQSTHTVLAPEKGLMVQKSGPAVRKGVLPHKSTGNLSASAQSAASAASEVAAHVRMHAAEGMRVIGRDRRGFKQLEVEIPRANRASSTSSAPRGPAQPAQKVERPASYQRGLNELTDEEIAESIEMAEMAASLRGRSAKGSHRH